MRRLCVAWLLVAACGNGKDDTTPLETAVPDSDVPLQCSGWDEFRCVPGGSGNCYAECLPIYRITCNTRTCFVQGRGLGSGEQCVITVPDADACGWCELAHEQCLGL